MSTSFHFGGAPLVGATENLRVRVAAVSIVIAAVSVVAASTFYGFQIRNQLRVRKTDLVMRLHTTWDSLKFQRAFHTVYWADFCICTTR